MLNININLVKNNTYISKYFIKISMKILVSVFLLSLWFCNLANSQINTPDTCKIPFGIVTQSSGFAYPYGLMPSNLPISAYKYLSANSFGKSQDAFVAYNSWKQSFAENCGAGVWRVKFDDPTKTVSEGIAYGMLLSAYAADKILFDGLWTYYKNFSNSNSVMHWKTNGCSGIAGFNGATDAELDAAMALIVAECQWPNSSTPYNYSTEATLLINAIKAYEIHPSTYQTINGDGWTFGSSCRNPSYFSPAYYREFAKQVPADSAFWAVSAVNASYAFLTTNRNAVTGLVSNWADPSGNPNSCNGPNEYGYDACRNPWRMATDVLWNNDANAKNMLSKTTVWLKGSSRSCRGPVQQNATSPNSGSHNSLFTSTWAVGAMGGGNQTLLNEFYTESVKLTDASYFGNSIRTIMLFMLSGNFWKPCPKVSYVELADFSVVEKSPGKIEIKFTSSVELENAHFNLYVSNDQLNYVFVKQFLGYQKSSLPTVYNFEEERYINEVIYYKLTFTDRYGIEKELRTVAQYRDAKIEAWLTPNPYENQQIIYISTPDNNPVPVKIVDLKGRIVFDKKDFPANEDFIHTLELPDGMYFLMVTYEKKRYSFKIQKH